MPNPDEAPVDPRTSGVRGDWLRQHHDGRTQVIGGPAWVGEPLPKATAGYLEPGPGVAEAIAVHRGAHLPARPTGVRTRLRAVLRSAFVSDDRAAYFRSDTEELCPIALPWSSWVEMGRPDRITVTIEPGDRLNP